MPRQFQYQPWTEPFIPPDVVVAPDIPQKDHPDYNPPKARVNTSVWFGSNVEPIPNPPAVPDLITMSYPDMVHGRKLNISKWHTSNVEPLPFFPKGSLASFPDLVPGHKKQYWSQWHSSNVEPLPTFVDFTFIQHPDFAPGKENRAWHQHFGSNIEPLEANPAPDVPHPTYPDMIHSKKLNISTWYTSTVDPIPLPEFDPSVVAAFMRQTAFAKGKFMIGSSGMAFYYNPQETEGGGDGGGTDSSGQKKCGTSHAADLVGDEFWTSVSNATGDADGAYAQVSLQPQETSNIFTISGYGLSIPDSATQIDGVEVIVTRYRELAGEIRDLEVNLLIDGADSASDYADTSTNWPVSPEEVTYGGPTDLWGESSISIAQVEDSSFGVNFRVKNNSVQFGGFDLTGVAYVDSVCIKVYYS